MTAAAMLAAVLAGTSAPAGAVAGVQSVGGRDVAAGGVKGGGLGPVSRETVFDLASVTKVVATTCALHRLAVLGELGLTDSVARYLPSSPCESATIATLLTHRAGLWEWQPLYLAGVEPWQAIDGLPLRYPANVARHYSDLGFMLLGRIVALVTGQPLDRAVAELVTGPLGLTRTGFGPVGGDVAASAVGDRVEQQMVATGEPYPTQYVDSGFAWRSHELVGEVNDGNCHHGFGGVAGHAGLFSGMDDLLTLGASLAAGEPQLWGAELAGSVFADGPDVGQALGWRSLRVQYDGRTQRLLWHTGFTGCGLGFIPGTGFAAALLSNRLLAAAPVPTTQLWTAALAAVEPLSFAPDQEGTIR